MTAVESIGRIRERLSQARTSVRLVGLSGVGKTRLVQALFDNRIGPNALDPTLVLYTNLSDSPDPSPTAMVSNLVGAGTRAIVVVDNCPPDLHRRLTEIAASGNSQASIITVEYDIREDQPEGTEVLEMEPASIGMTEQLVQRRFPAISQVDAGTIAEASGGNARLAIAFASTVQRGESLAGLADEQLFQRLFYQNHQPDPDLLRAAQASSLLYSFDGETTEEAGELARIGKLARQEVADLYEHVAELCRRDLVQKRGVWRAVLPHAVANRLAKLALQNNPLGSIEAQLVENAPDRIKKSFSRRLGYLDNSADAARIVGKWLQPGGMLADVSDLDDVRAEMFQNVAPVAPDAVLTALERAAHGPNKEQLFAHRDRFVSLIRSLAYEPRFFERCAELLAIFAVLDDDSRHQEARNALKSLFYAYLSGTHATVEQRINVMEGLIGSSDPTRQSLGLEALRALLEAWHFMSAYDFRFGSHSRDHGYHPNFEQACTWYAIVLQAAEVIALSDLPVAEATREVVAGAFRGLWTQAQMYDELERVSRAILAKRYWAEG